MTNLISTVIAYLILILLLMLNFAFACWLFVWLYEMPERRRRFLAAQADFNKQKARVTQRLDAEFADANRAREHEQARYRP